jgi:shikimate kinase
LGKDPEGSLTELYAGRADLYQSVAHVVVDVDKLAPDVVAERIASAAFAPAG